MIHVRDLIRDYRLTRRREGVGGGLVDLVRPRHHVLRAVDRVSFDIEAGEMVGYIGANGAGKSTTIKILTGILNPTSGTAEVGGLVPWRDRQRYTRHIGVVFGQRTQLWWDLAVVESFRLLGRIYDLEEKFYNEQIAVFDEMLGIGEFMRQPVRKLSLGQRMRCDLAAALLHRPPVLFLDEPTIGLDVVAKESVREFLRDIRDRFGTTVILTTHDLGDIQQLCRRVIIIDKGRILMDGELDDLRRRLGDRVRLHLDLREPATQDFMRSLTEGMPVDWRAVQEEGPKNRKHVAEFSRRDVTAAEVIQHVVAGQQVRDLSIQEPSIEAVVRRIYRNGGLDMDSDTMESDGHD